MIKPDKWMHPLETSCNRALSQKDIKWLKTLRGQGFVRVSNFPIVDLERAKKHMLYATIAQEGKVVQFEEIDITKTFLLVDIRGFVYRYIP